MRAILGMVLVVLLSGCGTPVPDEIGVGVSNSDEQTHSFQVRITTDGKTVYDRDVEVGPVHQETVVELQPGTYTFDVTVAGESVHDTFDLRRGMNVAIGYSPVRGLTVDARELDYF